MCERVAEVWLWQGAAGLFLAGVVILGTITSPEFFSTLVLWEGLDAFVEKRPPKYTGR